MSLTISLHHVGPTARVGGQHRAAKLHPPLTRREHVLARAESPAGAVVATNSALMLGDRTGTWRRIAWAEIASAGWSRADHCLTVRLWPSEQDRDLHLEIAADERLAATVRERLESARLLSVPLELPNGVTAHVLALRDGDEVRWRVLSDMPLDSPDLQRACSRAIAEIRSLAGI
jgi:hypothetical protein